MKTLIEQFVDICFEMHDESAVCDAAKCYSYGEILNKSIFASEQLYRAGIIKGDRVCLLAKNSADYVASYYAIWLCGGVVVALNADLHESEISNLYHHSQAKIMLADMSLKNTRNLSIDDSFGLLIQDIKVKPSGSVALNLNDESRKYPALEDLAAIIYTSGTTGKPKGVSLSHGNLLCNILAIQKYLPICKGDRVLNVLPFYYSYGNSVMHSHLLSGSVLYLENSMMFPVKIIDKIVKEKINMFYGVPSTYLLLRKSNHIHKLKEGALKYMSQAGGKLSNLMIQEINESIGKASFFVMYGQTEATARIAYLAPEYLDKKLGSVGKSVEGLTLEVRAGDNQKLPANVTGEVCVKGCNIMQGYWRNDAGTQEVMTDNWLKTGDTGYLDEDGFLFLTGRKSDFIKVGGNRISPYEIEDIISQIEGVDDVAVIGIEDDILGEVPMAYIETTLDELDVKTIKARCKSSLATYKIPKEITVIEKLPRTSSGKIKRYELQQYYSHYVQ